MALANLRSEERIGLGIALMLHVALGAAFLLQTPDRVAVPPVEKMSVSLTTEVGPQATAPDPVVESAAATAPVLAPEPAPVTPPEPQLKVAPPPPKPVVVARPKPAAAKPQPVRKVEAPAAKPAKPATKPAGGSRVGSDFLPGAGESSTTRETRPPASAIGASEKASLVQAIARRIKPKWNPPSGPEVDQITTYLRFRLNPDGSLAGRPDIVRQTGITDLNRPQAARHAEQAIRAVQLAAPFDLPDEYYNAWKLVGPFGFDWKLAQ